MTFPSTQRLSRTTVEDLSGLDYAHMLVPARAPTEMHHYSDAFPRAGIIPGSVLGTGMITDRVEPIQRMLAE